MKSDTELTPEMLQANPGLAVVLVLFTLVVIALLTGCASTWIWALTRWWKGQPVLDVQPWRPRTWGFIDLVLAAMLVLFSQVLGFQLWASLQGVKLKELLSEDSDSLAMMAVGAATMLAAMILTMLWLLLRYSATFSHIGFSLKRWWKQLGIGVGAAAMWLPVVIVIMALVSVGLGKEYDHPLIKRLNDDGTVGSYLLAVFCAVIAAPLVEEFLFRVLLQGWLQSIPWSMNSLWWLLGASGDQSRLVLAGESHPAVDAPIVLEPTIANITDPNPYSPGAAVLSLPPELTPPILDTAAPEAKPPVWPVFVAGTLFGLAHWDYGASFVPLIVLGIVLGFLYRATHSIWPCFVLHFCLNSFSMAGLGLGLLIESMK